MTCIFSSKKIKKLTITYCFFASCDSPVEGRHLNCFSMNSKVIDAALQDTNFAEVFDKIAPWVNSQNNFAKIARSLQNVSNRRAVSDGSP
jgi:hypothetical protein